MLNQEDYVKVLDLHRQGWSNKEIAAELGYHPATIAKRLRSGPPAARLVLDDELVMNARWRSRVGLLLDAHPRLLAVSVFNKIRAEGYTGSYPTVVRAVRAVRGPRFRAAPAVSVPIHTDPGEEVQFDFCDLSDWATRWGWSTPLFCFGDDPVLVAAAAVVVHRLARTASTPSKASSVSSNTSVESRRRVAPTGWARSARRKARRFRLHPPTIAFAAHHGTTVTACQAGDAKRKGKVERPFRQLQETFLPEIELDGIPSGVDELNVRAAAWLIDRVHAVPSRTTGEPPVMRLEVERPFLSALPRARFDTDYVETRRVHTSFPFIVIDNIRYSVPAKLLGQLVEIRRAVDADRFEIRWAGQSVATHPIITGGRDTVVWDPGHRAEAETEALSRSPQQHLPRHRRQRRADSAAAAARRRRRRRRTRSRRALRVRRRRRPGDPRMTAGLYEQIKDDLGYLGLTRSPECFATLADDARSREWSHIEFLARLVAEQATATRNRRLAARLRYARFPFHKTIDDFDFEFQPSVDRKLVEDLATLRFIDANRPILFLGQPGCGKTHLAVALAIRAVEAG